jgi:hypothetical protein
METSIIIDQIKETLSKRLGNKFPFNVDTYERCFGKPAIEIWFACSTHLINNVKGQMPQLVSLSLDPNTFELHVQGFGGCGGQSIYRNVDKSNPSESWLAMKAVKVPFRTPKKELKFVISAIDKFAENYIKTLKENKDVLRYQEIVNYNDLLN